MKIGIFTDAYEPHISGVTTSIKILKKYLEKMGHIVYIVTANLENNKFIYDEEKKILSLPGIKTGIYGTKITSIYSSKALKIIKKWDLDIIHSQTEFSIGYFSRIVAKKLHLPIVHTYHTLYEDYVHYVTHGHFDNLAKKLAIKLTRYYGEKTCREVIVPTSKIKDLFSKYGIKKDVNIIPTGIDIERFIIDDKKKIDELKKKYNISKNDFVIGNVGRIAKEKSIDKLLKSVKKMIDEIPNLKVVIVGGGPEIDALVNLTKELNLENNVIFTDKVMYDDIPLFYNMFDILVSYSKTETQGLTIIEALASSTPAVCINDDAFQLMIEDNYNGYLFNNDYEFKKIIMKLTSDKELYDKVCMNAKNSVYKYSGEVFASEVLKIYHKAIKRDC